MEKIFRSRGVSIKRVLEDNTTQVKNKVYYEPDIQVLNQFFTHSPFECLTFFEYSADVKNDALSSLNFHVDLLSDHSMIYRELSQENMDMLKSIPDIFDESFRNYTIGYRISDGEIRGMNFYFYPTVFKVKENRYGIRGITEKEKTNLYISRFLKRLSISNPETLAIVDEYVRIITKFKGVCVSVMDGNITDFKLYARVDTADFNSLLCSQGYCLPPECSDYGEIVLTAIRFAGNTVNGYNAYYFR